MGKRHLLVDISSHGFGHVAQTAPILNALRRLLPGLQITVRSGAPHHLLTSRIDGTFRHIPEASDFGLVMRDATTVDLEASAAAYNELHRNWKGRVQLYGRELERLAPDLLLSNVSYLALAAAARVGIPAVAMSSLNWADIYRHYFGRDRVGAIHRQMLAAYNGAERFLKLAPAMPMEQLGNACAVGTVARVGRNRREEINRYFALGGNEKLVLIAMGGVKTRPPVDDWPRIPGVRWLVQNDWAVGHPDALAWDDLGMEFADILCSSDVLLTKPGYGSISEAGANGVPVVYVDRPDWPEQECLVGWLARYGRCAAIDRTQFAQGDLLAALEAVWGGEPPVPPELSGAEEVAEIIAARLAGGTIPC